MLLLNAAENDLEWLDAPTQHDSAVMDFSAALSHTLLGIACFSLNTVSVLLYPTSRPLAVIFISFHVCTGFFIVQEPSLSPLCHFTVYASRRLYAINKLPPPCSVCNRQSSRCAHMQSGGGDWSDKSWNVCLPSECTFSLVPSPLPSVRINYSTFFCALRNSKRVRLSQHIQTGTIFLDLLCT